MRYFRKRLLLNAMSTVPNIQEVVEMSKWINECDGKQVTDSGYVIDSKGMHYPVCEEWTEEVKQHKYYFILKGETGYRALFLKSENNAIWFQDNLVKAITTKDRANRMLDELKDETELFRNKEELLEHLSDTTAQHIFLFDNDSWYKADRMFNRYAISSLSKK